MAGQVVATTTSITRRVATLSAAAGLVLGGAGLVGTAQAHPIAKAKTGTLIVKVLKGDKRVGGIKMCPYVDQTTDRAGKCERSNSHGIARLHHVRAGSIDLATFKKNGHKGNTTYGIIIKAGKVTHYTLQTSNVCPGVCS